MNNEGVKRKRRKKSKPTHTKIRQQRLVRSSKKPRLFISSVNRPVEDPIFLTTSIENELRLSAPSEKIFDELKRHYGKIRSRNLESSKVYRVSHYRFVYI